jgi:hypothetical protein
MTEAEASVRESLLSTLSFLASVSEQREFAAKVTYSVYQDEFACWWLDTFYPEDLSVRHIFSPDQMEILVAFSKTFEQALTSLEGRPLTIHQLQATDEWQTIIASANEARSKIEAAA